MTTRNIVISAQPFPVYVACDASITVVIPVLYLQETPISNAAVTTTSVALGSTLGLRI